MVPFAEIVEARGYLESNGQIGKIVVMVQRLGWIDLTAIELLCRHSCTIDRFAVIADERKIVIVSGGFPC